MKARPCVYLVSLFTTAALLTACGGPGAPDRPQPVVDRSQEPKVLSGTVADWTGEDAVVRAETYNAEGDYVILAKSPVAADGSFSLSLPGAEGLGKALVTVTEQDLSCETNGEQGTVVMTPERVAGTIIELTVHPASLPDSNHEDYLGSLHLEEWEFTEGIKEVLAVYVTEDVTVRGSCTDMYSYEDPELGKEVEVTDTTTYDLNLVAGWNDVVATYEDDENSYNVMYATGPLPKDLAWHFYKLVCEDEECEED